MAGYRERPAAALTGAVVWSLTPSVGPARGPDRVLPDGCMDIVLGPGGLLVAGPDTVAHLIVPSSGSRWTGLRLPPGMGPAVLGIPAHELRDRRVPLGDVWGDRVAAALERRLVGTTPAQAAGTLEALAARRLAAVVPGPPGTIRPDPALARLVQLLGRGRSVAAAADAVGLGPRQVHRRSLVAFGYGAKTLARILRLTRALDLARLGVPAATVAATAGYADQPHLAREVRALTGVPLGQLLR